MFCPKCGANLGETAAFCPYCGASLGAARPEAPYGPVVSRSAELFTQFFSSGLFLAVCILSTAVAALTLFGGEGLPVLDILFAVAGWMLYSAAKRRDVAKYGTPLKMMNGLATAMWVVFWVLIGILAVCGIFVALLGGTAIRLIGEAASDIQMPPEWYGFEQFGSFGITAVGLAVILLAVIMTLFNIFGVGSFRKCAASFKNSYFAGDIMLERINTARVWILIGGIFDGISFLGQLATVASASASDGSAEIFSALGSASSAAFAVCIFVLLGGISKKIYSR